MTTEYGSRLRAARKHAKLTQVQLSELTKIPQSTISTAEREGNSSGDTPVYAKACGVDAHWLATGLGEMLASGVASHPRAVVARHPDDTLGSEEIEIDEYNVRFSGGDGNVVIDYELAEESEPATYRLSWIQRMRLNPEKLKRFKVKGDSMETLLFNGDTVLVNTAENDFERIVDGKVYAIRYGNELRVKRLFRKLDGTLILHSDNASHKEEVVPPALVQQHITIIGRVRDKSGSGGL